MTTTLDQPAGKAVEAMPDAPADMAQAVKRLFKISGHAHCIVQVGQSVFRTSFSSVRWTAGAEYGPHFITANSTVSADDAVTEWVKAAHAKREELLVALPELPTEDSTLERMAREPYDARSPNAEEREACDPFEPI